MDHHRAIGQDASRLPPNDKNKDSSSALEPCSSKHTHEENVIVDPRTSLPPKNPSVIDSDEDVASKDDTDQHQAHDNEDEDSIWEAGLYTKEQRQAGQLPQSKEQWESRVRELQEMQDDALTALSIARDSLIERERVAILEQKELELERDNLIMLAENNGYKDVADAITQWVKEYMHLDEVPNLKTGDTAEALKDIQEPLKTLRATAIDKLANAPNPFEGIKEPFSKATKATNHGGPAPGHKDSDDATPKRADRVLSILKGLFRR